MPQTKRSTPPPSPPPASPRGPEKKIGPFSGGIGVAIWLNAMENDGTVRRVRSVTLSPRRYRDRQTGEWRDGAYYPGDIPALIYALQKAQEYLITTPLPGENQEEHSQRGDVPY